MLRLLRSALAFAVLSSAATAAPPAETSSVASALTRAGARAELWRQALERVAPAHRDGFAFLLAHMPDGDLERLDPDLVLENVALANEARAAVPWGVSIPEDIFRNEVLPYVNVSETRERWRPDLMARFLPLARACATPAEAAHRLNQTIFGELGVRYSTKRKRADQSPSESMETGLASCTGLSILLVDACRAVGVPARLVGIPNWVDGRGNHTWVEIWSDGGWHFAGAAEPDGRGLNHAWFQGDAAQARADTVEHAIYAVSYRRTDTIFPMVWAADADPVYAVNVTRRYARDDGPRDDETRLRVTGGNMHQQRIPIAVTIREHGGLRPMFTGVTRDESADMNDVLSFTVPRGGTYDVIAQSGSYHYIDTVTTAGPDVLIVFLVPDEETPPADDPLVQWFTAPEGKKPDLTTHDELLARDPAEARRLAWLAYRAAAPGDMKADFDANRVRSGDHESPYVVRAVGERPPGGWPLVIAMHGGGGAPKEVNDRGWRTMQRYYRDQPDAGGYLYLALRAPNDTWNGFYDDYVYPLVGRLVEQFTRLGDVDPDRVFLMGYSHGGYGAFAIGPKTPDRFAAIHASAAAPTDGQSSPVGLRTTRFTFMIGENDNAYGRRPRCEAFDAQVKALRGDRTDIYPVEMMFQAGYGHGGLPDRDMISAMYPYVRNPQPRSISWLMTDRVVLDHFWVRVPEAEPGRRIDATCVDNVITLTTTNVPTLTLGLDEHLVDLTRPVEIRAGKRSWTISPAPSMATLCANLARRGDPRLAWICEVTVDLDDVDADENG